MLQKLTIESEQQHFMPCWPLSLRPLMALTFLKVAIKGQVQKGPTIYDFRQSSTVIFVPYIFETINLSRHQRNGSLEMLKFDCWGGKERGEDADACKHTRIKSIFSQFRRLYHYSSLSYCFAWCKLWPKVAADQISSLVL